METSDYKNNFEKIALPHMNMLYSYALHLTMNSDNAKDLLQDTYLKAFRFWDKYEEGTNIKGWLYQIMKNSYINFYRKKTKEPRKIEYDENLYGHHAAGKADGIGSFKTHKSYEDLFEDEIYSSINSLPQDFKTVVLLSDLEDLSYEEIAKIVKCPIGTVRSRLHRGRRQLQKKLFDYAKGHGFEVALT